MGGEMATPSPVPWRECGHDSGGCICCQIWSIPHDCMVAVAIGASDKDYTLGEGVSNEVKKANTRLIVRAVNSFEAMREAIIAALDDYQSRCFDGETADKLRAALALVDKEGA